MMTQHMPTNSTTSSYKLAEYATNIILKKRIQETNMVENDSLKLSSPTKSINTTSLSTGSNNLNLTRPSLYEITKEYYIKNKHKPDNSMNKNVIFEENEHDLYADLNLDRPRSNRLRPMNVDLNDPKGAFKRSDSSKTKKKIIMPHNDIISLPIKSTTSIDENIIEQSIDLNLYKTSPTIAFIKQKYKMYLEWLNEHNKKDATIKNSINTPNLNSKTLNINQLSWYSYERSLRNQHQTNNNNNSNNNNSNHHSKPKKSNTSLSKKVTIELLPETKNNTYISDYKTNPQNSSNQEKVNTINASSLSNMSTSGIGSSVLSSTSSIENNLDQSFNKNVKFHNLTKRSAKITSYLTLKKINQSNTSLNNTINNNNIIPSSTNKNNVNTNNLNFSNNSTPMLSMTNQPTNIKPILKTSNLSNSMNDYYYNSSSLIQSSLNNNVVSGAQTNRRDSLQSSTGSNNDMISNNSYTNMSIFRKQNTSSTNGSSSSVGKISANMVTKLPPIARGSNDFNAVMQDLKKEF